MNNSGFRANSSTTMMRPIFGKFVKQAAAVLY